MKGVNKPALFCIINLMLQLRKLEVGNDHEDKPKESYFNKKSIEVLFKTLNTNYNLGLKFSDIFSFLHENLLTCLVPPKKVTEEDKIFSTVRKWKDFKSYYEENSAEYIEALTNYSTLPATDVWNRCQQVFSNEVIPKDAKVFATGAGNLAIVTDTGVFVRQVSKKGTVSQTRFDLIFNKGQIKAITNNPGRKPMIKFRSNE